MQPGIGYIPPAGSVSHLFTLPSGGGVEGRHPMDLGAHPFVGGLSNEELQQRSQARYGPGFHGTDETKPRFLALDFESIFGIGPVKLREIWAANAFGTRDTHDGNATIEETHDYVAVNPSWGSALTGGLQGGGTNDPPGCGAKDSPCWWPKDKPVPGEQPAPGRRFQRVGVFYKLRDGATTPVVEPSVLSVPPVVAPPSPVTPTPPVATRPKIPAKVVQALEHDLTNFNQAWRRAPAVKLVLAFLDKIGDRA